jgi:uncharacterized membrane protein
MTITTNRRQKVGASQTTATRLAPNLESTLTLAAGAALTGLGVWRRGWIGAALSGGGAYLLYSGTRNLRRPYQGSVRLAVTIHHNPEEVYRYMSDPENWTRFLAALRIEPRTDGRFELHLGMPAKPTVESSFEVSDHKPGEYVAWASASQRFRHRGVIHLRKAPGDRGTEVSVAFEYRAPAGPISRSLASALGWDPEQAVRESLRHLKQLLEAGEIPTTEGQPVGARGTKGAILRVLYRERPFVPASAPSRIAGD